MGLIKAILGAAGGNLADQWKDFFTCSSLANDVLAVKGQKMVGNRSSNTKGSDNVISNGSGLVVADGQCALIVEQGKVVEVCAEPGEYTYKNDVAPSIFAGSGSFGEKIKETFADIGKRFTYGGQAAADQRVYYFNMKEIMDNKFGTPTPLNFRVVDTRAGLDVDVQLRCSGSYIFKIVNPLLFYTNITGNFNGEYRMDDALKSQMKSEFIDALGRAMGTLSNLELRPSQLPGKQKEITDALNAELSAEWGARRGFQIIKVTMNPPQMTEEYQEMLKNAQQTAMLAHNPNMIGATLAAAGADAMRGAANNPNGAMAGFMGMGMAMNNMGMMNPQQFMTGGMPQQGMMPNPQFAQQQMHNPQFGAPQQGMMAGAAAGAAAGGWQCSCGHTNTGKFCANCGSPQPAPQPAAPAGGGWQCACGAVNQGKFCPQCGKPKPMGAPLYKCDKCGWTPPDPKNPPKFCPQCGDAFDENDIAG